MKLKKIFKTRKDVFSIERPFFKILDWEVNWQMPIPPSVVLTH
jgi:hypothetical protein